MESGKDKIWTCLKIISEQELSSSNMIRGKWERVSPRGIRPVDGRKENEENERVRVNYTLLYSNRTIDQ